MNATFDEILRALEPARTVLVASHLRPDGDALGSTIAFALWLRGQGKEVTAWNEDGMLDKFRYLPEAGIVGAPAGTGHTFDAFVALDTSVKNRLGTVLGAIEEPATFINIDHHISNGRFGTLNYIDSASPATGQIVFEFLKGVGAEITPAIATNLFTAISTDTGSFQYPNTTAGTFRVAAELIEAGVDVGGLSQAMYDSQPRRRLELLRHALNDARFHCDDRVVSFSLTQADVARLGVLPEDNEGIIDHLRSVDTVVAAAFFEDLGGGKVRVSSRSKDRRVDVCKVCALFGGGGHALAAGARLSGTIEEAGGKFYRRCVMKSDESIDGVLCVDKAPGMTSHDVVGIVRRALNTKKVGHCGTLDPLATGLLLITVGRGTKIQDLLMSEDKEYVGTMKLGEVTDSQDSDGQVTESKPVPELSATEIDAAFAKYHGDFYQTPPMVSAIKKDGVPLYKLARQGKTVEREPRFVHVYAHQILTLRLPEIDFRVVCSKGFYVRTYADDIGRELGCGAHLRALRRTKSGRFSVDGAITIDELKTVPREDVLTRLLSLPDVSRLRGA